MLHPLSDRRCGHQKINFFAFRSICHNGGNFKIYTLLDLKKYMHILHAKPPWKSVSLTAVIGRAVNRTVLTCKKRKLNINQLEKNDKVKRKHKNCNIWGAQTLSCNNISTCNDAPGARIFEESVWVMHLRSNPSGAFRHGHVGIWRRINHLTTPVNIKT